MNLINMQLTPDEAREEAGTLVAGEYDAEKAPRYPYGLTVCLCDEALQKLGLDGKLPAVGTKLTLNAIVEVVGVAQDQRQGETESDVRLQITDMALSAGPDKTALQGMYDRSNMNP